MPWVPIAETAIATNFVSDDATMVGSTITATAEAAADWVLTLIDTPSIQFRVTVVGYSASTAGALTGNATFLTDVAGSIVDQTNQSSTPLTHFSPDVFHMQAAIEGGEVYLEYNPATSADALTETYEFLIEVLIGGNDSVSYNCECDDPNPSRTLGELRTDLMRRLGFSAMTAYPPPGMTELLNSFLQSAQTNLYRQYKVLRTKRMFTWDLIEGVRFYDLDANEDVCTKKLDPRMIEWVGISDGTNWWTPIICGIPPECYSFNQVLGWPQRYEIRQCIEVWPAPAAGPWKLRIKGDFGLEPFAVDADKCTIDDEAVFLYALARAKAHYTQPDAANYQTDAMTYIKNLTSGAHMTRRYVPGMVELPDAIPPKWLPLGTLPP